MRTKGYPTVVRWDLAPHAKYGQIPEHIAIATDALGKPLPKGAHVHHVDRNPRNNANSNLVICQDAAYHKLLHVRTRVLKAGGRPDIDKICAICKAVKPKTEFFRNKYFSDGLSTYCKLCARADMKARKLWLCRSPEIRAAANRRRQIRRAELRAAGLKYT